MPLLMSVLMFSCSKDDAPPTPIDPVVPPDTTGVYVMNEGQYGKNNASITYYNLTTKNVVADYYQTVNGHGLGEGANDLKRYGSKIYCVVTGLGDAAQSYVEVLDLSCKTIKRIAFSNSNGGFQPRSIVFDKNKAYVSAYNGTVSRIDTTALTIEATVNAGYGLEGIGIANNKIYVANSSNTAAPNAVVDVVSVIDIATFTKLREIKTAYNPYRVAVSASGDVYVACWGNYADLLPAVSVINSKVDTVAVTANNNIGDLAIAGDKAYVLGDIYTTPYIKSVNLTTRAIGTDFITDPTVIAQPYGVTINEKNGDVFITNSPYTGTGSMYVFGVNGKVKYTFEAGLNPRCAVPF